MRRGPRPQSPRTKRGCTAAAIWCNRQLTEDESGFDFGGRRIRMLSPIEGTEHRHQLFYLQLMA
ncbi:hypothetical protein [Streptomyces daliensis]|uniref:Uncharacterized protein n=1 Tax=Streptomyces daliensis TaxID=299421 RepID=A0A8T4ILM7_9ACTN|nr:hypothetical protein [Streptomyces daliensis]